MGGIAAGAVAAGVSQTGTSSADGAKGSAEHSPASSTGQTSHKGYINDHNGQVEAVKSDVKSGSGRNISSEQAEKMLDNLRSYTGTASRRIRDAYNNPNADARDAEAIKTIDDYINSAPKWEGRVFRGINVSKETALSIISGDGDMQGPSSWSTELSVAEWFSKGEKEVSMIFTLDDNKSGASVTHISTFEGNEAEVLAPSGVKYQFDKITKTIVNGIETYLIDVHERN